MSLCLQVLGRFNAAEKMDNSRFWNWNESPIPLLAEDLTPETIQFQVFWLLTPRYMQCVI